MRFAPHTDSDVRAMLDAIGAANIDELFDQIPAEVRLGAPLQIPAGVSEQEIAADLASLAARNRSVDDLVCFASGGVSDHYVPAVVWSLAGRSEFSTSYTPYQPELSQGVLQTLFEFQSMMCELTAMEVANASLYDGATALAEAVSMARAPRDGRVLVSGAVDRRLVDTLRTYGAGAGYAPEVWGTPDGRTEAPAVTDDVAAVVIQHPNVFGILEDVRMLADAAHGAGAALIQIFDPVSLGVLAPPGDLGVDIAVAEGQPFGSHLNFGGPNLGILTCRMADVRRMPGRIVGRTVDVDGRDGYVLTLQAREQHIRREKATSNICTNQTLMALAATIHLAWLGPDGLREQGIACASKAAYAAERLTATTGVERRYPEAAFFRDIALRLAAPASVVRDRMLESGFLAGVEDPAEPDVLIVGVTERRTRAEIDAFATALGEVVGECG